MALKTLYSPIFISVYIYLILQLPLSFLFSGLLDEGFLLYNAKLISEGQIPYKDFFMTTTPGSFYVVAFFFKLFGNYMIIGRILGVVAGMLTLIICNKLFKLKIYWQYVYLTAMAILSIGQARTFFYNDAIMIALTSLYFLLIGIERKRIFLFFIAGVFSGICFLFKQSIGGLLIPGFILGIFLLVNRKSRVKALVSYISGTALILIPVSVYFFMNNSLAPAFYYIFSFAGSVKAHQSSFLLHRLIAIPFIILLFILLKRVRQKIKILFCLFAGIVLILYFIIEPQRLGRLLTYLPDPIFYVQTITFIFPLIIASLSLGKNNIQQKRVTLIAISYLVFYLSIAASGYSMGPAATVAPFFIPLVIYISDAYGKKLIKNSKIATTFAVFLILLYTASFSHKPNSQFGAYRENQYTQKINIEEAKYIYAPPAISNNLKTIVSYIKNNSKPDEKIFCFPYCPGLYFFTDRNSASHYSLFYFETFMTKDQDSVIYDLQKNNVRLVVLQKTGDMEQRKELEKERLSKIYNYILANYNNKLETDNFIVLKK